MRNVNALLRRRAEQRVDVERWGQPCRVLDLDALIGAKRAAGREKDREALLELEAIRSRRSP